MGVLRVRVDGEWIDIPAGTPGPGVPLGGTTNQVLVKASDTDYHTTWASAAPGGGGGGISTDPGNLIIPGSDSKSLYTGTASFGTTTTPRSLDGDSQHFANLTVVSDGTASSTWPDRLRFNFDDGTRTRRTGHFNEYGEVRAIAARLNTTALVVSGKEFAADGARNLTVPILQVIDDGDTLTNLFSVYGQGNVAAAGVVTASNISPNRFSSGTTPPANPAIGDIWVDTN